MDNLLSWNRIGIMLNPKQENSCREIAQGMKSRLKDFEVVELDDIETEMKDDDLCKIISSHILPRNKRIIATIGSGAYHHLTYGLCKIADSLSKNYLYIHIDHHIDSWRRDFRFPEGLIDCKTFVPYILEGTNANMALALGDDINSIMPGDGYNHAIKLLNEKKCQYMKEDAAFGRFNIYDLERILDSVNAEDAYVTFDLDVMHPREIITSYTRGDLSRNGLLDVIRAIKRHKRIIGVDVVGYSTKQMSIIYTCNEGYSEKDAKIKSMGLYEDIISLVTE